MSTTARAAHLHASLLSPPRRQATMFAMLKPSCCTDFGAISPLLSGCPKRRQPRKIQWRAHRFAAFARGARSPWSRKSRPTRKQRAGPLCQNSIFEPSLYWSHASTSRRYAEAGVSAERRSSAAPSDKAAPAGRPLWAARSKAGSSPAQARTEAFVCRAANHGSLLGENLDRPPPLHCAGALGLDWEWRTTGLESPAQRRSPPPPMLPSASPMLTDILRCPPPGAVSTTGRRGHGRPAELACPTGTTLSSLAGCAMA